MRIPGRALGVLLAAATGLLALESWSVLHRTAPLAAQAAPMRKAPTGLPASYDEALARIDVDLAHARAQAEAHPDEWLRHELLARRLYSRARLTGSFDDYAAAEAALRQAFAVAPPRIGPHMTQAVFDFTMHRLAGSERQLDRVAGYAVTPDVPELAEIVAMRGDIAFYRGDYDTALEAYQVAQRLAPGTADFRLAVHHMKAGRFAEAEDYFNRAGRALSNPTPQQLGNLELQRGVLDLERGRRDAALAHFRRADRIFPGYWLIQEHIAEVTALNGDLAGAERLYRDIVRRTGHPEFMDALAGVKRKQGDAAAAAEWSARAAAVWRQRLRQFPEAAYGHALDHCVAAGNWRCALSLAERNHRARPYGDAKIALAQALLHNGRRAEAKTMIEAVLASPWRTADLHSVAAEIYAAAGDARAKAQLAAAYR
jgi:tetratricopeptide (TPR) repeat protein